MRKIRLVVAGLILVAGTGAWVASSFPADAGEPKKAMADSCCVGRDGVISKVSCPYLPEPYALVCVHAQASVKKNRGGVSYPSRVYEPRSTPRYPVDPGINFPCPARPYGDPVKVVGNHDGPHRHADRHSAVAEHIPVEKRDLLLRRTAAMAAHEVEQAVAAT